MATTEIELSDLMSRADIVERVQICDDALRAFAMEAAPGYELGEFYHPYYPATDGICLASPDQVEVHVLVEGLPADKWLVIERIEDADSTFEDAAYEVQMVLWTSDDGLDEENSESSTGAHYAHITEALAAAGL